MGSKLQPAIAAITIVDALPSTTHNRESSVMEAKEEAIEAKEIDPIKEAPRTDGKKAK
jgi:hypothetical protein